MRQFPIRRLTANIGHGRLWCRDRGSLWVAQQPAISGGALSSDRLPGEPVVAREAEFRDVAGLCAVMMVSCHEPTARLALGKRCFIAKLGDEIASYGWVTEGRESIPELECSVRPSRGEAYVWDCYTLPAYRGRGILPILLGRMTSSLRAAGITRLWAIILAGNSSSERAFSKAGYYRVAWMDYVRLLRWHRFALTISSQADPELVASARRLLCLDA